MRIFITGGSGFIGRHLAPLLALRQHEVLCLSHAAPIANPNAAIRQIQGDLNDPDSYVAELERFKPECCIHLAWSGLPDYSIETCRMNLLAGIRLYETLERVGCGKLLNIGTCWEYGKLQGAMKESDRGIEPGLFAAFKTALCSIGQSHSMARGARFIWARVFFVYGPGQRSISLIPSCYRSFKNGEAPKIANPLAVNDFIYVADVAAALCRLVEADEAMGIYNIGSGRPVAVWEVVNSVATQMGFPPVYADMPHSTQGFWADVAEMASLGWQAETSLQAGIAKTLEALEAGS